jgi:hypothetical protein
MSYLGQQLGQGQAERFVFTASGGETSVTTSDDGRAIAYTVGQVDVYLNGAKLINGSDFTATTGTSITGLAALTASDVVEVFALSIFQASDTVSAASGGTFNGNVTMAANLSFGDNDKAIFGAGSDLQIYHDGTHSRVVDAGTGNLNLQGDNLRLKTADAVGTYLEANNGGAVTITYNSSPKLATTATGIDVTGTVTADGLTVSSAADTVVTIGTTNATADGRINFRNSAGTDIGRIWYNTSGNRMMFYTDSTERMRIDSSGNLLVGTSTTPSGTYHNLVLANDLPNYAQFTRNSGAVGGGYVGSNGAGLVLGVHTGVVGSETYSEAARFDLSGNLLVGTTSTSAGASFGNVYIAGDRSVGSANNYAQVFVQHNSSTNHGIVVKELSGSGPQIIFLNSSGTLVGEIATNASTTTYNTSSDYRLKDVDGPITNSGAYIDALKPVQGSWKADGSRFIGLIAHEVQEVSETPIATGEKDGEEMQGMDYSAPELIANLIAEIQSLRARVAQLEGV